VTCSIRQMGRADEEGFLLFLSAWIPTGLMERYQWIYKNNPHGRALTWLAIDQNSKKIAGCTSVFPKKLMLCNHPVIGSVGGDTYVAPTYRRQGIAKSLYQVSLADMRDSGIRLQFGFPLADNLAAFRKAGAYLPGSFATAKLFLSTRPLFRKIGLERLWPEALANVTDKVFLKFTGTMAVRAICSEYAIERFLDFDDSFGAQFGAVSPGDIWCVRDTAYLRWRFLNDPVNQYALLRASRKDNGGFAGFMAMQMCGHTLQVCDLFASKEDGSFEALVVAAIDFGLSNFMESVALMVNPLGSHWPLLESLGFRLDCSDLKPLEVLGDKNGDRIDKLGSWYLTTCDLDV
jgi:hypothetical protein